MKAVCFQSPFNTIKYTTVGDDQAPTLFSVSEESGEIRVKQELKEDTAREYTVSILYNFINNG